MLAWGTGWIPKTKGLRRSILLMPEALTRWRALQREERLRAGEVWVMSLTYEIEM
jgi:hypothetical protein